MTRRRFPLSVVPAPKRARSLASLALGLAVALPLPPAVAQEDRPVVEIAPGRTEAFRIAVQRFRDEAQPPNPRRADDLRQAIQEALSYSAVLLPIDDAAFLSDLESGPLGEGRRSDCGDWTQSGADALAEGRISSEGDQLVVEFAVWDTARCLRLARTTRSRAATQGPRLARQVADQIVAAFTGTAGSAATELAFISDRSGDREVWVMDADGRNARPATRSRTIKAFPAWLPDGAGILYTAYHDEAQPALFITARRQGIRPGRILRSLLPGRPKYRGAFDPKGDTLALVSSRNGASELYLVPRGGASAVPVASSPAIEISPAWSPDGDKLAFVSDRSGSPQLYVVDRDGRNLRRLTYQGSYNTAPSWSPDGRWIAYETRLESQFDIWLIDPSGETHIPLVQHRRSDESPSWSPDGRKIAFSSNRRGRYDIYVMDVHSGNSRRLTRSAGTNLQPSWGPFPD